MTKAFNSTCLRNERAPYDLKEYAENTAKENKSLNLFQCRGKLKL
jgi:hypothetical protein